VINVKGLARSFRPSRGGEVVALAGIDLDVASGEFAALTGPSGSGKTTLLFAIGGLLTPTAGSVTVAGTEVSALSAPARARWRAGNLGFVFQTFHLVPYLSALENVCLAPLARGRAGTAARESAEEILGRLGLADRLDHLPGELSAGEQQRVSLARALANGPRKSWTCWSRRTGAGRPWSWPPTPSRSPRAPRGVSGWNTAGWYRSLSPARRAGGPGRPQALAGSVYPARFRRPAALTSSSSAHLTRPVSRSRRQ